MTLSVDETADLGRDIASPGQRRLPRAGSIFSGVVDWVQIDRGTDDMVT